MHSEPDATGADEAHATVIAAIKAGIRDSLRYIATLVVGTALVCAVVVPLELLPRQARVDPIQFVVLVAYLVWMVVFTVRDAIRRHSVRRGAIR